MWVAHGIVQNPLKGPTDIQMDHHFLSVTRPAPLVRQEMTQSKYHVTCTCRTKGLLVRLVVHSVELCDVDVLSWLVARDGIAIIPEAGFENHGKSNANMKQVSNLAR